MRSTRASRRGIALGVVQPEYVNFAGVAPIIIYSAADDRVFTIPGLGPWPKAIERDFFKKHHGGKIPQGILRTVVPAAPDAWITALERFGTMSFGEVAASAIGFAHDGFPVYPLMSEIITEHEAEYRMFPSSVAIYLPQDRPPRTGEIFVQKELAATMQYMADQEAAARHRGREAGLAAARDAFYRGDIASRDRQVPEGERRLPLGRRSGELSLRHRGAGRDLVRRYPALCLRPVVPGAVAAAGAQPPGWRRAAQARPQLHRLPAPHHRGGEARVRRPRGLFRRSAHRRRADRGAAVTRLCAPTARDDPPGSGLARNAAGRRSAQARRRTGAARRRDAGAGERLSGAAARHLSRLRHRPGRQRVRGDAERRLLQRAGGAGARHHSLAARQPELGRSEPSVRRRTRQAAAAHAQSRRSRCSRAR